MSDESVEALCRAKESDKSVEEVWEDIQQLNEDADWDIEQMLPEVYGDDT